MTMTLDLPLIIRELNLDVPIYRVQTHDDCVDLYLYGGKVVTWRPRNSGTLSVTDDQYDVRGQPGSSECINKRRRKKQ